MSMNVTTPGASDPRREENRKSLLAAARRLFALNGYADTTIDEIVLASAVARGAFYSLFEDRQDIFKAVSVGEYRALHETLGSVLQDETLDPFGALMALVRAFLEAANERGRKRILYADGPVVLGRDVWNDLDRAHLGQCLSDALRRAMKSGTIEPLPVEPLVAMLAAALWAALATLGEDPTPKVLEERVRIVGRMLRGMRATDNPVPDTAIEEST